MHMPRTAARVLLAMTAVAFGACSESLTGPSDEIGVADAALEGRDERSAVRLTVMTRNVFVGTDVDQLIGITDPNEIPFLVTELWQLLLANDPAARMAAIAREIAEHEPHLVGLQEVSTFRVEDPGQGDLQPNAQTVVFDFVPMILAELDALGLHYEKVAEVQNMDVELPRFNDDFTGLIDVRVTDYDVILARSDVRTSAPLGLNYAASWFLAPGVEIPRGLTAVDAVVDGQEFRVFNTHPEPVETLGGSVQSLQASELRDILVAETRPTVLLGDLNTEAKTGDTYAMLTGAGFLDVFDFRLGRRSGELTCCHDVNLSSDAVPLVKRIDHVMVRNFEGLWGQPGNPGVNVTIVGDMTSEKTDGGLWPSDHAGVVASFVLPRPQR